MRRTTINAIKAMTVMVACAFLAIACSTDASPDFTATPDEQTDQDPSSSSTSTTEATTTTAAEATTTTLSPEDLAYDEEIALADKLMEPIRGYRTARTACLEDPPTCDSEAIERYTAGEAGIFLEEVASYVADGWFFDDPDDEVHFVRHRVDSESPLTAAVWTCSNFGSGTFRLDQTGTTVEEYAPEPRSDLVVFQVVEQADGDLAIEQILSLTDEGDERPEGGTCETYENWPPPRPSS